MAEFPVGRAHVRCSDIVESLENHVRLRIRRNNDHGARLARQCAALRVKQLDFVNVARCLGKSELTILMREVVPNCLATVVALGTLIVAEAILLEASLSYFGLTSPDSISWGAMLTSGQKFIYQAWWLSVFPGCAIFLTVLAFNLFGESLRLALDPKAERR